ncbi:MAG: hypothetical protein KAQ66_11110, partial [Rhodospirillaceae bacterium]|nr:hypothetical protein [Rhodospirillaceae bacterium]
YAAISDIQYDHPSIALAQGVGFTDFKKNIAVSMRNVDYCPRIELPSPGWASKLLDEIKDQIAWLRRRCFASWEGRMASYKFAKPTRLGWRQFSRLRL